ncbi:MAG: primosomal protein N' [Deltaproteobacteria bacterium]|nr:primosomal protein N' [Deltaproteobacteria bacterium]
MKKFVDVSVALPVEGFFTYSVPEHLLDEARPGRRVAVEFGRKKITAIIVETREKPSVTSVKPLIDVIDSVPVLDSARLKFLKWMCGYYLAPPGEVFFLAAPSAMNPGEERVISTTGKGLEYLETIKKPDSTEAVILDLAKGGKRLSSVVKAVKKGSVYAAVTRLREKGFLTEEVVAKGPLGVKTETVVRLVKEADEAAALEGMKAAPLRRKVFEHIKLHGEIPLSALRDALGSVDEPVRRLVGSGLLEKEERVVDRDPFKDSAVRRVTHKPNDEQAAAIGRISAALGNGFSPFLLYGITGSGKTFVYLKAIEEAVRQGKRALFLVPEIGLTERPAALLNAHFPGRVAVVHSSIGEGERADQWRKIRAGGVDVVIGARSALFAPLSDIGLIIVDEEHDPSYKQDDKARYNARDSALMLAKTLGIAVILGSATPSVETYNSAITGKFEMLRLTRRVDDATLPEVELFDMKKETKGTVISGRLRVLMEENLTAGNQTLVFLNRRGFSSFVLCRGCGSAVKCLNCSVTLTFHKRARALKCHYCDFTMPVPESCPGCASVDIVDPGIGTEKVEEEVRGLFPKARVARLDSDTTSKKGSLKKILDAVEDGSVDILVGTQMAAKGHHFPRITLVGIVSGDTSLGIPDFRSGERTFQLMAQASGRAGRESGPSKVLVQTFSPEHFCFHAAATHDYDGFYKEELLIRKDAEYPPYERLALVRIDGIKEADVEKGAALLRAVADKYVERGIVLLGPVPALIEKVRGRTRRQMLVKCADASRLNRFLVCLKRDFLARRLGSVRLLFDVDPSVTV